MTDLTKLFLASLAAASLALSGCRSESGSPPAGDHAEHGDHEGHDHDADGHADGHADDHADDHRAEGDHGDHGTERDLGSVTIAGTTLRVSMGGEIEPSATVHLDVERTDGPEPAAIRVWIGDEAGTGAMKSKAMGSGGGYHADAELPAELSPEDSLWIEIETADGTREAGSISLN